MPFLVNCTACDQTRLAMCNCKHTDDLSYTWCSARPLPYMDVIVTRYVAACSSSSCQSVRLGYTTTEGMVLLSVSGVGSRAHTCPLKVAE
jgi:hypothetical protein